MVLFSKAALVAALLILGCAAQLAACLQHIKKPHQALQAVMR